MMRVRRVGRICVRGRRVIVVVGTSITGSGVGVILAGIGCVSMSGM